MYDSIRDVSDETKAMSMRLPVARVKRLMRLRKAPTATALVDTLLAEEEERLRALKVLKESEGKTSESDWDESLL